MATTFKLNLGAFTSGCIAGTVNLFGTDEGDLTVICADHLNAASVTHRASGVWIDSDQANEEGSIPTAWLRSEGLLGDDVVVVFDDEQNSVEGNPAPEGDRSLLERLWTHPERMLKELEKVEECKKVTVYAEALEYIVRRSPSKKATGYVALLSGANEREFTVAYGRLEGGSTSTKIGSVSRLYAMPGLVGGARGKSYPLFRADLLSQLFRDICHVLDGQDVVTLHLPENPESGTLLVTCERLGTSMIGAIKSLRPMDGSLVIRSVVDSLDHY